MSNEKQSPLELVWEHREKEQSKWAIVVLQRLLAFNILLVHGRYGEARGLDYGDRIPLRGPITLEGDSLLDHIILGAPDHYAPHFHLESGRVDFLHAVGITQSERDYAKEHGSDSLVKLLKAAKAYPVTDPERVAVV
jgi:suppressor of fused protein SUFU